MQEKQVKMPSSDIQVKSKLSEKIVIFMLLLSAAFSITYWAIAKYDVYSDYKACGDAQSYIEMSKHNYQNIQQRYRNRILMPAIVSFLNDHLKIEPFLRRYYEDVDKKIIQLNFGIVNIFALTLTAFTFFYYCLHFGFSKWESLVGSFLYLTSFFVVNYYTVPMVDSLSTFFIMGGFYAVLRGSVVGLFLSFLLGVFTKETTFIILPLILLVERRVFSKKLLVCMPGVIAYAIFAGNVQKTIGRDGGFYLFRDIFNIIQGKFLSDAFEWFSLYTFIEYIQVFMFLWILFFYALFRCRKPMFLKRSCWLLLAPLVTPFLGTAAVGRVVFYLFPIVIPFALLAIRDIFDTKHSDLQASSRID